MENGMCQLCKNRFEDDELYEYRGFTFCEKHFDEGIEKVDAKRALVMEITEKSTKSQAVGEWNNGGYKTMKTDVGGSPIPSEVKEPLILKDYEEGIL